MNPEKLPLNYLGQQIDSINDNIIIIGIAGGSGSGKTTLASAIQTELGKDNIITLCHDYYYKDLSHLTKEQREKFNFDHPDALETSLLIQHIKDLKNGKEIDVPSYNFFDHIRNKETTREKADKFIILVEGILIFTDPELYNLFNIKIYVDTDDDIRFIRRLKRDVEERQRTIESIVNQYLTYVRPMHKQYVEPSKKIADIIVPEGLNGVALDIILSHLKDHLKNKTMAASKNEL